MAIVVKVASENACVNVFAKRYSPLKTDVKSLNWGFYKNYNCVIHYCPLSTVYCQLSTVNSKLSPVNCSLSTIDCRLSTITCWLLAVAVANFYRVSVNSIRSTTILWQSLLILENPGNPGAQWPAKYGPAPGTMAVKQLRTSYDAVCECLRETLGTLY